MNKISPVWRITIGVLLTSFYVVIYFFPEGLGLRSETSNVGLIGLFDPLSFWLKKAPASQWFVYGCLYTFFVLSFGIIFIIKHRNNSYQLIRTLSVMFFQLSFAFLIPEFLQRLNYPYLDLKNMWPLNYYYFFDWHLDGLINSGQVGLLMLSFGLLLTLVISPLLTYKYGKRWYCSWVCGCGGLAETAGDAFRQYSNKSSLAWKLERWLIYPILFIVFLMTVSVLHSYLENKFIFSLGVISFLLLFYLWMSLDQPRFIGLPLIAKRIFLGFSLITSLGLIQAHFTQWPPFLIDPYTLRTAYGFLIGSLFSGVIGVGFYPILGNRVWCRFGCPMAAILGFQQKFLSRFRIQSNASLCIACGNCSTYCEMGIDVRAYALSGKDIKRSSCVGCGICESICPRGVLRLTTDKGPNFQNEADPFDHLYAIK